VRTATYTRTNIDRLHDAFVATLRVTDAGDQAEISRAQHTLDDIALEMGMRRNQTGMNFARRALSKAGLL